MLNLIHVSAKHYFDYKMGAAMKTSCCDCSCFNFEACNMHSLFDRSVLFCGRFLDAPSRTIILVRAVYVL